MIARQHTIVDGTNLVLTSSGNIYDIILLEGTAVLTVNWGITFSGTPKYGETFNFRYTGKLTLGGNTVTILGASVPAEYGSKDYNVTAIWNGGSWDVVIMPDFDEADIITSTHLLALCVTTTKINDLAVTTGKMALLSVDSTILAADSVITTKILDANVTLAKIATQAANTVLVNATAGAASPTAVAMGASTVLARLAAGNIVAATVAEMQTLLVIQTTVLNSAQVWVGSAGNLATARTLSNDITMTNTGVVTIANDAITTIKVLDSNITEAKLGNALVGNYNIGPLAGQRIATVTFGGFIDANPHNMFYLHAGDIILDVVVHVGTAGGAATIDVGYDANVNLQGAGADTNGLIEAANCAAVGPYSCLNATYDGAAVRACLMTVVADGWITVQSTAASAGLVADAYIIYIPA